MTKKKKDNLEARAGDRYYTICVKNSSISETLLWIGIHFLVEPEKKRIYLYMPICSHKRGNMHWHFMSTFWYKNWISAAPLSFHACWYNDFSQTIGSIRYYVGYLKKGISRIHLNWVEETHHRSWYIVSYLSTNKQTRLVSLFVIHFFIIIVFIFHSYIFYHLLQFLLVL